MDAPPFGVRDGARGNVSLAEPAGITSPGRPSSIQIPPAAAREPQTSTPPHHRHRPSIAAPSRVSSPCIRGNGDPRREPCPPARRRPSPAASSSPRHHGRARETLRPLMEVNSSVSIAFLPAADVLQEKVPEDARALRRADAREQHALQGGTQGHCPGPPAARAE